MTNLVLLLLRVYVTTNTVPGYVSSYVPPLTTNAQGYLEIGPAYAISVDHPPRTVIATNYVIGIKQGANTIELLTLTAP